MVIPSLSSTTDTTNFLTRPTIEAAKPQAEDTASELHSDRSIAADLFAACVFHNAGVVTTDDATMMRSYLTPPVARQHQTPCEVPRRRGGDESVGESVYTEASLETRLLQELATDLDPYDVSFAGIHERLDAAWDRESFGCIDSVRTAAELEEDAITSIDFLLGADVRPPLGLPLDLKHVDATSAMSSSQCGVDSIRTQASG